ncbi:MAG: hypothetical protein SVU69_00280 [Pseudomonadota bacterium]|nr:hypothetical protein [Pseudomonadota bacterium]
MSQELSLTWRTEPEGKPNGYLRTYRIYGSSKEPTYDVDAVTRLGTIYELRFRPVEQNIGRPFVMIRLPGVGVTDYALSDCEGMASFGRLLGYRFQNGVGEVTTLIRNTDGGLPGFCRNIVRGDHRMLKIRNAVSHELVAVFQHSVATTSPWSSAWWKRLWSQRHEQAAGTIRIGPSRNGVTDKRLMVALSVLLHYEFFGLDAY